MSDRRKKRTIPAVAGGKEGKGASSFFTAIDDSSRIKAKRLAIRALWGMGYAIMSFLFGRTPLMLDTYPLGIALLCASDKYILYLLFGGIASAFSVDTADAIFSPYIHAASYILAVVIRITARALIDVPPSFRLYELITGRTKRQYKESKVGIRKSQISVLREFSFSENIYLRMATSCIAAFSVSLFNMRQGGYRYYDLFSAMFGMLSAPAFVFLFSGIFPRDDSSKSGTLLQKTATLGLIFSLIFSLCNTYVFGISLSVFAAFSVTLYFSRRRGILPACVAALVCGLAVSPLYAPAFILAAISSGLLFASSPFAAVGSACTVAMLWGTYIDGFNAFTTLLPALLSSSLVVCTLDAFSLLPRGEIYGAEKNISVEEKKASDFQAKSASEKMQTLSETFGELSSALYNISDSVRRPSITEMKEICSGACGFFCRNCQKAHSCNQFQSRAELEVSLAELLQKNGRIEPSKLPPHTKNLCFKLPEIALEINTRFAELVKQSISGNRTELFALDYEAVSHILTDAIEADKLDYTPDKVLSAKLSAYARRPEVGFRGVMAYGTRKKHIYIRDIGGRMAHIGADELQRRLESVCGFALTPPIFNIHAGRVSVSAESARRFEIKCAKAVLPAGSEIFYENKEIGSLISGDSVSMFENSKDCFYSLISDGMGSGKTAALSSEICDMFLTKMLEGGNKKETAIKMLNTLLRSKSVECSATIDLMEADLLHGHASFLKSGAAPSFVRRGDKLFKLRSHTFPIGIMRIIDAEQVKFELQGGDIIVMISDGVSPEPEECVWLMEMLCGDTDFRELSDVAKKIAQRARNEGSQDDISVVLMRVDNIVA